MCLSPGSSGLVSLGEKFFKGRETSGDTEGREDRDCVEPISLTELNIIFTGGVVEWHA